jgi:hypothetical protein
MAGALPSHILVHTATPVSFVEGVAGDEWIEGEPGEAGPTRTEGVPFECVLFLPGAGGAEPNPYKPRVVRRPTLLFNPTRNLLDVSRHLVGDESPITLSDRGELLIDAPELTAWTPAGVNPSRWQADGDAQPFGPPGRVVGVMATLVAVED